VRVGDDRVYGLKGVIELVTTFMTRVERNGSLHSVGYPVLVVEGFRGTGKTAALNRLARLLNQVPHARLDLEKNRGASVPEVLSAIAFDLSKRYPKYTLRFPRFIIGQLVMGLDLNLTDHSQACETVESALEHDRDVDAIRKMLVDTAGSLLTAAGVPIKPPRSLMYLAVTWLSKHAPGRQLALGSYQKWYGHRDLGLHSHPIDVLVDLNRWATDIEDEDNRQRIDELLLAAFLADLRSEFDRGRRAGERSLNAVVLLDNADSRLGRHFLGELVHTRRQRAVGDRDQPDPLTVVATSRGLLLTAVSETDVTRVTPAELQPARAAEWSRSWWLGYRLPDLTHDEVGRAIKDLGLTVPKQDRLTRIVYGLTGGHQASTSLVLDAIAKSPPEKWVESEVILGRSEPGGPTVEEQIRDHLLLGTSEAEQRDLVTCAPTRTRAHALALVGQEDLLVTGHSGYEEVIDPILWPVEDSAGLATLRRLLIRCLAQRTSAPTPTWSDVYSRLRRLCRDGGDKAGELYYALADGELGFVATRLHELLTELDSAAWFGLHLSVVEAPYLPRSREVPIDEVRSLVESAGGAPTATAVGRLVAALHIAADPFTDSRRRDVHLQIADDYAEVGRLCPGGPHAVFLEASRRHRRQAEWWD
jgi:hypothetical protein